MKEPIDYTECIGFPMFSGWIKDQTGDWAVSFYVTAMMLLIPAILMLIEPLIMPDKYKHEQDKTDSTEKGPPDFPTRKLSKETDHETESLLVEGQDEIIRHRPSKIYKAYNNGQAKTLNQERVSAPLAAPETI